MNVYLYRNDLVNPSFLCVSDFFAVLVESCSVLILFNPKLKKKM
uniref:Uncharacterized protein n=1 Tax=Anguilla anguilla TaxID=7936 RepID=A0A0E9WQ22_ANGAN